MQYLFIRWLVPGNLIFFFTLFFFCHLMCFFFFFFFFNEVSPRCITFLLALDYSQSYTHIILGPLEVFTKFNMVWSKWYRYGAPSDVQTHIVINLLDWLTNIYLHNKVSCIFFFLYFYFSWKTFKNQITTTLL